MVLGQSSLSFWSTFPSSISDSISVRTKEACPNVSFLLQNLILQTKNAIVLFSASKLVFSIVCKYVFLFPSFQFLLKDKFINSQDSVCLSHFCPPCIYYSNCSRMYMYMCTYKYVHCMHRSNDTPHTFLIQYLEKSELSETIFLDFRLSHLFLLSHHF